MIMHFYSSAISLYTIITIEKTGSWKAFDFKLDRVFAYANILVKFTMMDMKKGICANPDQEQHVTLFTKIIY